MGRRLQVWAEADVSRLARGGGVVGHVGVRQHVLEIVADAITALRRDEVVRVAVDGVDGAGKTVFADEVSEVLASRGIAVVRASVDGFHQPAEIRHRQGRRSPQGFFEDSYDYDSFRRLLLEPLGPGGDRRFVRAIYDDETEQPLALVVEVAPKASVLVVDGIFLHRPALRDCWDLSVFLEVDFEVSIPRGAQRGYGDPDPSGEANRRYVEGQRLYLSSCRPATHATIIIDNNDLDRPRIVSVAPDR